VTASDASEARRIGRTLVAERLAACVNIFSSMNSIYWWDEKVEEASEAVLILKTTEARLEALVTRVKALHSYDCPCIEAWPVAAGYGPFLDWVTQATHGSVAGPDGTAS
jgi:periplasmic divalent cation tolerance protein